MISLDIIDTDAFLEMPATSQNLYFHLNSRWDDDGFVSAPNKVMKICNAGKNDYDVLIAKKFIIPFESWVCVIRHWKLHNYIRSDRYTETMYKQEKAQLALDGDVYQMSTKCLPNDNQMSTNGIPMVDVGKDRIGEDRIKKKEKTSFEKPTQEEVEQYCKERGNSIDPSSFINFYDSKGRKIWKENMKDWKACIRTREQRNKPKEPQTDQEYATIFKEIWIVQFRKKYWEEKTNKIMLI